MADDEPGEATLTLRDALIECMSAYIHARNEARLPHDQKALLRWRRALGSDYKTKPAARRPSARDLP